MRETTSCEVIPPGLSTTVNPSVPITRPLDQRGSQPEPRGRYVASLDLTRILHRVIIWKGVRGRELAVSIIRKTAPKPGWRTTTQIPQRVLTCEACGALCDEATTEEHDAWHGKIEGKSLPLLLDFLTGTDDARPAPETAAAESDPPATAPVPNRRHIQLPKLMAADELRRQPRVDNAELDDDIAEELDRAEQIA